MDVLILGGGLAGVTTALALTKHFPAGSTPKIQLFEVAPEPRTRGGAVNLTPNALRLLDNLGALKIIRENRWGETIDAIEVFDVYRGKIAETSFAGKDGKGIGEPPYKALRITRGDALKGLLRAAERHPNISIHYGRKTTKISETSDSVSLTFADGSTATGALLLGCDGIHSTTRLTHVDPSRTATYSGVTNAFGYSPRPASLPVHFTCAALNFTQRGMILTSFVEPSHSTVYIGGLMEMSEPQDRDGWRAHASDTAALKAGFAERFRGAVLPALDPLLQAADDFYLWPVFTLSRSGTWATERTMLLGDAAHAMPPQGESTGIVFEDCVLFARCLARWAELSSQAPLASSPSPSASSSPAAPLKGAVKEAFNHFERLRRGRIETAWDESQSVLRTVKDAGPVGHRIKMTIVPWYLWWTRGYREKHFVEDVCGVQLGF